MQSPIPVRPEVKVYGYRWVILTLFSINSMSNGFHWIEYSMVANIVGYYYDVSSVAIDWTSMSYMITFIPFMIPAVWFQECKGLRICTILGAAGTAIGSWVKCFSYWPDRFYVTFIGQAIVATSQVFILPFPSKVAAVWFGQDQVSTACAIGVFGNQIGVALSCLISPAIVQNSNDKNIIGNELAILYYAQSGVATLILLLVIILFREKPLKPPSVAAAISASTRTDYINSVKKLLINRDFILLTISFGFAGGVFLTVSTFLNQVCLVYFPGHEKDAGIAGLLLNVSGMVGAIIFGIWLDKSRKYK